MLSMWKIGLLGLTVQQAVSMAIAPKEHGAVYFLRVDPAGSQIVAIETDGNGLLVDKTSTTSTGGVGLQGLAGKTAGPVDVDPLQSQDAVFVEGNLLFTVNSGSNTAVVFEIDPRDPTILRMLGKPASTLGDFPVSITFSPAYQTACVLNGGAKNGVTCFKVDFENGLVPDGQGLRNTDLHQVSPPVFFHKSYGGSDIRFSPDSSKLVAAFKGPFTPTPGEGKLFMFDVEAGKVSSEFKDASNPALKYIFGFDFDPNNQTNIFISDATYGGSLIHIDPESGESTLIHKVSRPNLAASCWTVYSSVTNSFYDMFAGSTTIPVVNPKTGFVTDNIDFDPKAGGAFDGISAGRYMYFLGAANQVVVVDLIEKKSLQTFVYGKASDRGLWTSMAVFTPEWWMYHE